MKKRIAILGATGSIGCNTIDVVRANMDDFDVVALTAHRDIDGLVSLGASFPGALLAATGLEKAHEGIDFFGAQAAVKAIQESRADVVVNGIAGAAGLLPSVAALEGGADLALANKETIVMAGPLVLALAKQRSAHLLPVDSEHSAVFHLINAHGAENVEEIILTASGGPFRGWSRERLASVRLEDALAHPTWKMGGKITIDSASLANKGLEVIEAVRLFDIPSDRVSVLVHPQSRVHSLVRLKDGSLYAQVSNPDMRVPIHNALFWPECRPCTFGRLDLADAALTFAHPDLVAFPMLSLAYEAARLGGLYPTAYNAADEVAVAAFTDGRIAFLDIAGVTRTVLDEDWNGGDNSIESILEGDRLARERAARIISEGLA